MTIRSGSTVGAPCWTDLWTSDVEVARSFYADLFGWEALEPSPEFGGYFMFARDGVPVAGGMGPMGDMPASNRWRIYLSTSDMNETLALVTESGAQIAVPAMPVADLGIQSILVDPTGADLGAWEPGTFPGFTVLNEHGAPSWFELLTRDYSGAVEFYRSVFHWDINVVADVDDFRYSTMVDPQGGGELAGIGDATSLLQNGEPACWSIYWEVDDVDGAVARVRELGGAVVEAGQDTPYGRLATVRDPLGAQFKFRTSPA
ncbi:MAG: VOC family protein [Acidimicrobiales bacterium]|jgi:predicted enzyme related to lactoylglutathione lyase